MRVDARDAPKCQNPGCTCPVPKEREAHGDRFCGPYCAANAPAPGRAETPCGCGHSGCEPA